MTLEEQTKYYKGIRALLAGLKTVKPLSEHFHIHQFKDTPDSWIKETSLFRSNTYSIILLKKGKAQYKIGLSQYEIGDNSLYFMAPQHLRYYNRLSDWEGYVLVFTEEFFEDHEELKRLVLHFDGFKIDSKVVVHPDTNGMEELNRTLSHIYDISYTNRSPRLTKAKALLELLIIQITELYEGEYGNLKHSKPGRILHEFERILEEHMYEITTHQVQNLLSISEIASMININATYLGEVVKKATGKSPKQILSERLILEAKSLLHNTEMSISEVAYFLKFEDPSNFTKFFKSKTGISPAIYRNNQ